MWTRSKTICSDYDLGFGVQQLIPNSQVITSRNQTARNFPKPTSLNSIAPRPSCPHPIHPSLPVHPSSARLHIRLPSAPPSTLLPPISPSTSRLPFVCFVHIFKKLPMNLLCLKVIYLLYAIGLRGVNFGKSRGLWLLLVMT